MMSNNTEYAYITLPWARTEVVFNKYNLYSLNWAVEANFRGRTCAADYAKLIDGTQLYRMFQSKLWLFKKDSQGYYLDLLTKGLYRFTYEDPSLNVKRVWDWLPI